VDFKDTIGYMIHRLAMSLDSASDRMLRRQLDIGLSQLRILLVLEELDGVPQQQIAEELSQTEASVSRQIKILSKKGMIEVEGSFNNKRQRLICQTHQGHEAARRSVKILNDLHNPLLGHLNDGEQRQLVRTLKTILERSGS
jgi:DNA-binding MarR family transcriptional regulator